MQPTCADAMPGSAALTSAAVGQRFAAAAPDTAGITRPSASMQTARERTG